jgi:hypothetical protein
MLESLRLVRLGNIPVPMEHRDSGVFADLRYPQELVVDEGLERRYVQGAEGRGHVFIEFGKDGEKRSFGLSGRSPGVKEKVVVATEYFLCGGNLHGTESFPAVGIYVFPDEW